MIQSDHLTRVRKSDQVIAKKKKKKERTCLIVDFAVLAVHRDNEKRDKHLTLQENYEICGT